MFVTQRHGRVNLRKNPVYPRTFKILVFNVTSHTPIPFPGNDQSVTSLEKVTMTSNQKAVWCGDTICTKDI